MTNEDFLECRFIQEEMRYLTYDEFCDNCYEIKSIFKMMNKNAKLDLNNLRMIRDLLLYFEREHDHDTLNSGKLLIKREYVRERIKL